MPRRWYGRIYLDRSGPEPYIGCAIASAAREGSRSPGLEWIGEGSWRGADGDGGSEAGEEGGKGNGGDWR